MSPVELSHYRDLKEKIRAAKEKEEQEKAKRMKTPSPQREQSPAQKSILKSAEEAPKVPEKQVPVAAATAVKSPNANDTNTLDASPTSSPGRSERKAAQIAFKKAIRRGNCSLKELIDQFFVIEEHYLIADFVQDMQTNYSFARAMSKGETLGDGQKVLGLKDFLKYATEKKIKFKQHHVVEILRNDSLHSNISFQSFIKLLILASCGGDRTKIGVSNFKKLMNHMDMYK